MESFTPTRAKKSETNLLSSTEKSDRQPVDKYGGRVRSVVGENSRSN